jgi:hypothetical protein
MITEVNHQDIYGPYLPEEIFNSSQSSQPKEAIEANLHGESVIFNMSDSTQIFLSENYWSYVSEVLQSVANEP